ncbi:MAG: hypothetical protein AB7S75_08835 [Desulfococcaceae bacterium]
MNYIRFAIHEKDDKSGREKGLFSAMSDLLFADCLYEYERELEQSLYSWFKKNLRVPAVLSSKSNHCKNVNAISWFKVSAKEHIDNFMQYARILEAHDVNVVRLLTDKPGTIVYEDDYQIAAVPFADTFKKFI